MVYKKDLELHRKWAQLMGHLDRQMGIRPKDLNAVLFLIGVQELGKGLRDFSKEDKQDLMHVAVCKVLSFSGYYVLEGIDEEGWPHWKIRKELPKLDLIEQETLLKIHVLEYFEKEIGVNLAPMT